MNETSIKEHDLGEMCRLCLTKDTAVLDIFCFSDEICNQLSNVIMSFAPVQIKRHDEMPSSICRLCYNQLQDIHKFQVQIVQSDKTLRQYLQQLHTSDQQIKSEFSIQNSSEEHNIHKTNHSDVTEKSVIFHEIFGTNLTNNEVARLNYNSVNKRSEDIPLKLEIKDDLMDDNSLNLIDCADDTVETLSKGDGSEFVCEDTKVEVGSYTKLDKNVYENNFTPENKINQDLPLKFKIKHEPRDDNSSNPIECADDIVETLYKPDDSDNSDINRSHVEINHEKHKKVTEKKYFCDICNKSFNKLSTLKTHMSIHTSEKPYRCDICNTRFRQLHALNYHKRTHTGEKPYQCDVCNTCFSRSDVLNRHKRIHTGEKPYECNVCNKFFTESSTLNIHKRTHTDEKPYQCDVCERYFSHKNSLNNHKRTHTGEKPHQCDVCNKGFYTSSHLVTHKRTHTGEKPYQCDVCNKCFSQPVSLSKHKLTHTDEKPYQCDVCNMCFSRSDALYRHKRTGEKPNKCDVSNGGFSQSRNFKIHRRTYSSKKSQQ